MAGRVNGETQRLYAYYRENTAGERLQSRVQLSRDVQYASAWRAYQELRYITSGVDDLISRGNGPVQLDARAGAYFDMTSPRFGDWQFAFGGYVFQQGVEDYSGWLQFLASWYPTEKLTLRLDLLPQVTDDWLLWKTTTCSARMGPTAWISISGSTGSRRRATSCESNGSGSASTRNRGRPIAPMLQVDSCPAHEPVSPFTVNNLGLQIRYRYEFAPQSELFLVYARGGFDLLDDDERAVSGVVSAT